ncbi:MAG: vWA domain-containing protein [Pseudomonas marincola]
MLILLKLQPDQSPVEIDPLLQQLEQLKADEMEILSVIARQEAEGEKLDSVRAVLQARQAAITSAIAQTKENIEEKQQLLEGLKEKVIKMPPAKKADVVENIQGGEEDYLLGLKVEGARIVFLIDTSASMTDELLLDIIRRKTGSAQEKKAGPKWQRTKRITKWLANRIPNRSQALFIAFNEKAQFIGPANWFSSTDANAISSVFSTLDALVPTGATNLEEALRVAKSVSSSPTNYYLVTDGLPTTGNSSYRSLNPFANCSSLFGKSNTISGECRLKLFQHTVKGSGLQSGRPINIVLLPLEGDPAAAPAFWSWTFNSGGLLISPAKEWP